MATINLLPWREQLREERKKMFLAALVACSGFAVLLVVMLNLYLGAQLEYRQARNNYLKQQVAALDKGIAEVADLKQKKAELLDRMEVIQGLQGNRPVIVRVFDQLVRLLPDGVHFKSVRFDGQQLKLVGVAESNSRISTLMRNFSGSEWFRDPNLTAVRKVMLGAEQMNEFDLTIVQTLPAKEGAADS